MQYLYIAFIFFAAQLSTLNFDQRDTTLIDPGFTEAELTFVQSIIDGVSSDDLASLDGGKLYKQNCSSCHGRKGGLGISGATNLKKSEAELSYRVAMIYYGKGKMQSYKDALEPAEMVSIATYVETLRK